MTATTSARPPRIQLNTVTGVRGILSMTVFLAHCGMEPVFARTEINDAIIRLMVGFGEAAVSFFFMLSGFVLVWAWRPTDTARLFWRRRVVKIYPNHVTTWAVGLLLMVLATQVFRVEEQTAPWWQLLPSLALVHVWIPLEGVIAGTDGPAWSLSCEMFFYAMFPLLLVLVNRIRQERLWRWLLGVAAVIGAITVLVAIFVPSSPKALGQDVSLYQFYVIVFIPPIRLLDFVLGMLVARIVINGRWPEVSWTWVGVTLAGGWLAAVLLPAPLGFVAPLVPFNLLLLGKAATMDLGGHESFFTRRSVVWLGDVSFGFYLTHWLVLHYGRVFLGGGPWSTPVATAFLVAALVVALATGELLRRYVELPAMKRWARPRPKPSLPSSSVSAA